MLDIFANSMMTATRTGCVQLRDVPPKDSTKSRRWFARRRTRCVDLNRL